MPHCCPACACSTSRNLPGPFATRLLADLGATIVKVEPPGGDRRGRWRRCSRRSTTAKDCRTIDFRSSAELDRLRAWVQEADVLLDSFRPGVLQGLGLDAATLHALNPRPGDGVHHRLRPTRPPGRRRRGTT